MSVERFMTEEWNRYTKGKGPHTFLVLLAESDLFEAFAAGLQTLTREVPYPVEPTVSRLAFKSARMYQLQRSGWRLVIEGTHGTQIGTYQRSEHE